MKMKVLGMMSGTSLDGLDLAMVEFPSSDASEFKLVNARTIEYSPEWKEKLEAAFKMEPGELGDLSSEYGKWLGQQVQSVIKDWGQPDLIASHGHTVFHRPQEGVTVQIGNGPEIREVTGLPVVCDFRAADVSLGGQGAPLVPIGDQLLFGAYDGCLNLGGFSNISYCDEGGQRVAYDISPVNIVLNHLAGEMGKPFDKDGEIARVHSIDPNLYRSLEALPFYQKCPPRSLGREWVEEVVLPLIQASGLSVGDKISTFTDHTAHQIGKEIRIAGLQSVLVTGGGAYNRTLIESIERFSGARIILPDDLLIQFKEAVIFALLGWLRWNDRINVLSSVTGAVRDHSSGVVFQ